MTNRCRAVFLGTPDVAAMVLQRIHENLRSFLDFVAVVTQPPARSSRRGQAIAAPVELAARSLGIDVLTPATARDPDFLQRFSELKPDLCITAAYGHVLPNEFLAIPQYGTLNIHPSLLPRYRGAAPVQRAVEAGDVITGVTIALTVREMDAGPIICQEETTIEPDEVAPDLLQRLFVLGTERLVAVLPDYIGGAIQPCAQDSAQAFRAKKLSVDEAWLDFSLRAEVLFNRYRAFFGWPGVRCLVKIGDDQPLECKVIKARFGKIVVDEVGFFNEALCVPCEGGGCFEILELQFSGKKPLRALDFRNGLRGRSVSVISGRP